MESNRARKNNKKKRLTHQEKLEELTRYEKYISVYPKGQMCTFYLRGLCWFDPCQFAHGISDLNFDNFLAFHQDKKARKVSDYDLVKNVQRNYLIFKRDYRTLFQFQEENKDKVSNYYTYEQLNEDPRRRVEIRRLFHNKIFSDFCILLFSKFNSLTIDQFEGYVDSLGFSYNFRYFVQKQLFSKSVNDKTTQKKRSVIKMMPKAEEMMANFINTLLLKINDDLKTLKSEVFPLSFKYVNNIINKHIGFEDPLIHHYLNVKNITSSEFMEELVNNQEFYSRLEQIVKSSGLELPPKEELIYTQNITEVLTEIKDTCWDKYFNSSNDEVDFGFMDVEFIKENYIKKIIENRHSTTNEGSLLFLVKKFLNCGKNLIFLNNNYNYFFFNLSNFSSGVSLSDYFISSYEKRCGIEDQETQKMVSEILKNEGEIDLSGVNQRIIEGFGVRDFSEIENKISELKLEEKEIILVEDFISFSYFVNLSENFKQVSVDLEGVLSRKSDCKIDLIQIGDSSTRKIFVFDIYKILNVDKNMKLLSEVKIVLTWIFESNTITKIFHDGRNDVYSLHSFFQICPTNYIDTSCIFSAIKQFKLQTEFYKTSNLKKIQFNDLIGKDKLDTEFQNLYSFLYNSVNPGLNKVLEQYEPNKTINHLKDKMHQLFGEQNSRENFFIKRPIDEEFLLYSALDVKYLHGAFESMKAELEKVLKEFYGDTKPLEVVLRILSNDHLKSSCFYKGEVNEEEIEKLPEEFNNQMLILPKESNGEMTNTSNGLNK